MQLHELVTTSAAVAGSGSRLAKTELLATLLRRLLPDDVDVAIAFLSGTLRQGRIGIGAAAIRQSGGVAPAPAPGLSLQDVDAVFEAIARRRGAGSASARSELLVGLLQRAAREEQDFLVRLMFGELRQGALEGVLVDAIAQAAAVNPARLRRALMMAGELAPVARAVLTAGEAGLEQFAVRIFQPVQPMLAQPSESLDAALDEIGPDVSIEWKLDGARIQVHKSGDQVRVYSRNLRDVTPAAPEIVEACRTLAARDAILDGEVIALTSDAAPHPFQVTMQRFGRKLEVARLREALPLTPFFFDCLYADGESLLDRPQADRAAVLARVAPASLVPALVRPARAAAQAFLDDTLRRGHEGVMVKALASPYAAGRRGQHWLKVKAAHTLDLVVLAAEWGHGRRRGWLSNLHLGARDPADGSFVMLGKTFKGMTDEMLAWQTDALLAREVSRDAFTVFVRPELVVEVAFNDLQASSHYPGGLALRFARVKGYRPDKAPEEADTIDTVRGIFERATGGAPR